MSTKKFYLGLAAVLVLSLVLLQFGPLVVQKVAEAIIVAVFMAGTVDIYLKQRLAREVVRDISPYLMSARLPEKLRTEVAEVCRLECCKSGFEQNVEIVHHDEGHVLVKTTLSYTVDNLLDHPVSYTHFVWVEKCPQLDGQQIGTVGAENVQDEHGKVFRYSENGQNGAGEWAGGFRWTRQVFLPPRGQAAGRFWQAYRQVLPVERYEPLISIAAMIGARVRVTHPPDLHVEVEFEHRLGRKAQSRRLDNSSIEWEFDYALPPYSTIAVTWRPNPVDVPVLDAKIESNPTAPAAAGS